MDVHTASRREVLNGTPLTATDVAFSINRARASTLGLGYIDSAIKSVTAPDPSTVVITTKYLGSLLADISLFTNGIYPADFGGKSASDFFKHPVGTGPFMFASWSKGQSFKVVRNPNYWQAGKPYLDSVTFTSVPDDDTRSLQLQGDGHQHVAALSSIESLKAQSGVRVTLFRRRRHVAGKVRRSRTVQRRGHARTPDGSRSIGRALRPTPTCTRGTVHAAISGRRHGQRTSSGCVGLSQRLQPRVPDRQPVLRPVTRSPSRRCSRSHQVSIRTIDVNQPVHDAGRGRLPDVDRLLDDGHPGPRRGHRVLPESRTAGASRTSPATTTRR